MSGRSAVLVIAGSDSSGGAGMVRDLKALADLGVDALCAMTAVTAQTHDHVVSVHHVPPEVVRTQIRAALGSTPIKAVKIGMLGTSATVGAVADTLPRDGTIPIVLDPVLLSSSAGVLLDEDGQAEMRARLIPLVTLLTPNIPEAATLCDMEPATSRAAMLEQARSLIEMGARAVLLKGGHADGAEAVDLLLTPQGTPQWLSSPRLKTRCRGTGCALASAIAAGLARGESLENACHNGKEYVLSLLAERLR